MNRNTFSLLAISALTISGISSMQASSFNNNIGLSGVGMTPAYTLTFDSAGLATNAIIGNQFAFAGVTFSTPLFYDGNSAGGGCKFNDLSGDCLTNYASAPGSGIIQGPTTPFSIFFATPQAFAAFALVTDNNGVNNTTLSAFLGNTLVESAVFTTGSSVGQASTVANYFGFYNTAGSFNRITISTTGANLAIFDNLQVSNIPEPGTIGMLALGLGGVVAFARRRRIS